MNENKLKETDVTVEWAVELLVRQAAQADTADAALKFSQAACNSANAMAALAHAKQSWVR